MLGLSLQEIINIGALILPGQTLRMHHHTYGQERLRNIILEADREFSTQHRAAYLALRIQSDQVFDNGNTRTATACMYALLVMERGQFIRAPAYQAYGQIGYWGPRYAEQPRASLTAISTWILNHMYGPTNLIQSFNTIITEIQHLPENITQINSTFKNIENRNDPIIRSILSKKRSWIRNHGY